MNNIGDIIFSWTEDSAANFSVFLWAKETAGHPGLIKKGKRVCYGCFSRDWYS